jgi:two-component system OmpR family sensor kinase
MPPPNGPQNPSINGPMRGGPMLPFQPFLGVITAIVASLIFAWLLARYFSKPIRSLRTAFGAIAGGNLNTRLDPEMGRRSDELADLGRDFDTMAERLTNLVDGQRRMLHEVSHELRSPLSRLQVAIGLARQQPDKIDSSLTRIERESARMEKLVSELLTISRLDASGHLLGRDDIDLGGLVAKIIDDARFEAEASGNTLEFVGDCSVCVQGDMALLHSAIENVVRNAVKHTTPGTEVIVEALLNSVRNEIKLTVLDRGPGVPEKELQVIFEPFFRGASTVRNSDGHGLGLAIATRVVSSHGGRIVATNRDGGGLRVEIFLPVKIDRV